jgi:hypothetical protein
MSTNNPTANGATQSFLKSGIRPGIHLVMEVTELSKAPNAASVQPVLRQFHRQELHPGVAQEFPTGESRQDRLRLLERVFHPASGCRTVIQRQGVVGYGHASAAGSSVRPRAELDAQARQLRSRRYLDHQPDCC